MDTRRFKRLLQRELRQDLRKALGWSQEELSVRVGFSRPSIANIEIGRQRVALHDIENFARAFQTTSKHLIKGILT